MKTSSEDNRKISLSKRKYLVVYPCCSVLAMGLEITPCWCCGEVSGVSYHDIPLRNHDLRDLHAAYRQGTSTVHTMFSQVKAEFLKCPHP